MGSQFKSVIGVITRPVTTLKNLPSASFYFTSFIIFCLSGYSKYLQKGSFLKIYHITHSNVVSFLSFLIGLSVLFIGFAFILSLLVRIHRKRLTVKKTMNLIGYSLSPDIFTSVLVLAVFCISRWDTPNILTGGGLISVVYHVLWPITFVWSWVLLIIGLVKSDGNLNESIGQHVAG
jgi:hypothetical protein